MDDFESEIKRDFLNEAKDLLAGTERCFLTLEKCAEDPDNLNSLFRLAHNLKGSSGAVGFADLADFTHKLESLLLALKEKKVQVSKLIVDLLLRCNDYLLETIEALQTNLRIDYKNPELADELARALNPTEEPVRAEPPTWDPAVPLATVPHPSAAPVAKDENIRVSLSKIEQLLNNVGELVILQVVIDQQSLNETAIVPPIMRRTLSTMAKIVRDTQEISMSLRMLPIKQTFQKMQRIVRDTSKSLDKEVVLTLTGEETEVDKTVLESIGDPLVHIIRNAVDHGLEDADSRTKADKPAVGHVSLSAFHRAGHVVIEVRDDGRGLDAEKLVEKAKSKGILAREANLSKEQAYQLIFDPGFSTKDTVTDISGRGVGMDVVKTNISRLQGQIEIETELGRGTCFRILLPLTLAIVEGVVIRLKNERYVVPLSQINEFFRPKFSEINSVHERSELLTLREEILPAFRLSHLLHLTSDTKSETWDLTALIARDADHRAFAVMVDEVLGQQQIVIKSLGHELRGKQGVMGSAILGDGKPVLILDLFELTKPYRKGNSMAEAA